MSNERNDSLEECEQCGFGYIVSRSDADDPERYCSRQCEEEREAEREEGFA